MKIAIVCGHFIPDLGYFEVHLAKACSRLGHNVRVVTSVKVPSYVSGLARSTYTAGQAITLEPTYSIERLPALVSAGQMVISIGVKKTIMHFDPDLIFVIGLGKIFPKPVFDLEEYNNKTFALLGDNEHSFSNGSLSTSLLREFFKKPVYQKAIKCSKRLFAYTLSTENIVADQVGQDLSKVMKKKLIQTTLGFDSAVFKYDPEIRNKKRRELKIENDFTWVCVSRISSNKDFEPFLLGLRKLKEAGSFFKAIFVGAEGNGVSNLLVRVKALDLNEHVTILPFQEHDDLNALYNAADAAWYPMAAISNFEGLGTGLPILLPYEMNVSHILKNGFDGDYYEKHEVPDMMLEWTEKGPIDRRIQAANACEEFEYKSIVRKLLEDSLPT